MTPKTPQCEVFWHFNLSFEFSGVLEDSKFPLLGVWASPSHLAQNGVETLLIPSKVSLVFLIDRLPKSFANAVKRNPYLILSKAFSKSRRSKMKSWSLSSAHSRASWAMKTLSRMDLPSTNPV